MLYMNLQAKVDANLAAAISLHAINFLLNEYAFNHLFCLVFRFKLQS